MICVKPIEERKDLEAVENNICKTCLGCGVLPKTRPGGCVETACPVCKGKGVIVVEVSTKPC